MMILPNKHFVHGGLAVVVVFVQRQNQRRGPCQVGKVEGRRGVDVIYGLVAEVDVGDVFLFVAKNVVCLFFYSLFYSLSAFIFLEEEVRG